MPKLRELTKDPPLARGDAENQLEEMRDYLIKVVEELKYLLTHLEADNINDTTFERIRGMIPTAYRGIPAMDGVGFAGGSAQWSPGDHRHPTDTSRAAASALTTHTMNRSNPHQVTKTQVGLGSVADERQYSADNPPPYPVISVNGETGAVVLDAADVGARAEDWMPTPADVGAQPTITAAGILKGDGNGGVSAAAAGTDYATPAMIPTVPSAYTNNPEMDGTASPGSSGSWAKGDHVHPSDTSKANQAQLAYVEAGSTASRNYSAGEFFCWNGSLYQATAAISSGASFNSGSGGNCKSVYASDYSAGTWAPITTNATVIANAPERNGYARYGSLLVIYIALELKADLANLSQIDICDDVAGEMGVSSVLTPFANAPAFSVQRSAGSSDIILRVQYNSNKLTLINRSGTVASKTNRFIYGYIPLAVL